MKRKKNPNIVDPMVRAKQLLESGEVEEIKGYDPGHRLAFAGISRNIKTGEETNIKYSSRSFHYDAGEYRLTEKYQSWSNELFKKIEEERNTLPDNASSLADPDIF